MIFVKHTFILNATFAKPVHEELVHACASPIMDLFFHTEWVLHVTHYFHPILRQNARLLIYSKLLPETQLFFQIVLENHIQSARSLYFKNSSNSFFFSTQFYAEMPRLLTNSKLVPKTQAIVLFSSSSRGSYTRSECVNLHTRRKRLIVMSIK